MSRTNRRDLLRAFGAVLPAALLATSAAHARPGGGHSFSSRSSSSSSRSSSRSSSSSSSSRSWSSSSRSSGSSSSGGGGGGEISLGGLAMVAALVAVYLTVHWVSRRVRADGERTWDTGPKPPSTTPRQRVQELRQHDPGFSVGVLEDFLTGLFVRVHEARGRNALDDVGAWLSAPALTALSRRSGEGPVTGIVVGALRFTRYAENAGRATVAFDVDAVWEVGGRGSEVTERWTIARALTARSRTPESARAFPCNACGAPLSSLRGNRCESCGTIVNTGDVDWVVASVSVVSQRARSLAVVEGHAAEAGTDNDTVFDADRGRNLTALFARDPAFDVATFQQRVRLVFEQLQEAWSENRWTVARAFVTDEVFQNFQTQLDDYARRGLRNQTKDARITRLDIVRVDHDSFFDVITVRLWATGADFTTDASGRVVSGSATRMRPYSEYWTLLRSADRKGAASTTKNCPQCQAPLQIEHTGACAYCQAKVSSGQFDWVLSRIEQDDVYAG